MIREAIVLAGGLGTRLHGIVNDVPKPMAMVAGKPFLHYILTYLESQKIERVILSIGHLGSKIIEHFGDSFGKMELNYSSEETPLGTGGAIRLASGLIRQEPFVVVNGDTFFPVPLQDLIDFSRTVPDARFVIALKKMDNTQRYGTVSVEKSGLVTSFNEKRGSGKGLINGGAYLFTRTQYPFPYKDILSLEHEVLPAAALKGQVYAVAFDEYFIDIGIPDDYRRAQTEFLDFQ